MIPKKRPQRMCVGCQAFKDKKVLVRIVRTPAGEIAIDKTGKLSGRGAYLCLNRECLNSAHKAKRLERALKMPVPNEVYENLRGQFDSNEP